jgi:putative transposase
LSNNSGSVASVASWRKYWHNIAKKINMPFHISAKLVKYFKGYCSAPEIIMLFVYIKCRFSLSYRDLEEMAVIRGIRIDHATGTVKLILG